MGKYVALQNLSVVKFSLDDAAVPFAQSAVSSSSIGKKQHHSSDTDCVRLFFVPQLECVVEIEFPEILESSQQSLLDGAPIPPAVSMESMPHRVVGLISVVPDSSQSTVVFYFFHFGPHNVTLVFLLNYIPAIFYVKNTSMHTRFRDHIFASCFWFKYSSFCADGDQDISFSLKISCQKSFPLPMTSALRLSKDSEYVLQRAEHLRMLKEEKDFVTENIRACSLSSALNAADGNGYAAQNVLHRQEREALSAALADTEVYIYSGQKLQYTELQKEEIRKRLARVRVYSFLHPRILS